MARPDPGDRLALHLGSIDGHHLAPVLPISVGDLERDRRAERQPAPDPGHDVGLVALDRHPPAAAVTTLPPLKITGQVFFPHGQAGGHAVENDGQPLAMGFAGREQAQRHAGTDAPSSAARITSSGAFLPVQISKDAAP